ncbi:MAG: hypothetical protein SGPRY_002558 [Prymnesium sp.]
MCTCCLSSLADEVDFLIKKAKAKIVRKEITKVPKRNKVEESDEEVEEDDVDEEEGAGDDHWSADEDNTDKDESSASADEHNERCV